MRHAIFHKLPFFNIYKKIEKVVYYGFVNNIMRHTKHQCLQIIRHKKMEQLETCNVQFQVL